MANFTTQGQAGDKAGVGREYTTPSRPAPVKSVLDLIPAGKSGIE
jgi:hypothetical protein